MEFTNEDILSCVFYVIATEDDIQDKIQEIVELSYFKFDDNFEQDEDCTYFFRVIGYSQQYSSLEELKKDVDKIWKKYWFVKSETTIYLNEEEIVSNGQWLV